MIKLSLGSGKVNLGEDWTHIDATSYEHVEYSNIIDLSKFADNSVEIIYASHVLEYFDRQEVIGILKEWKRVLKKDGILRLAVPDFESMSELYYLRKVPLFNFLGPLYGKMESGGRTVYHKTCYDFASLGELLKFIGFGRVTKYDCEEKIPHNNLDDQSHAYIPHMDKKGTLISLNVEAVK